MLGNLRISYKLLMMIALSVLGIITCGATNALTASAAPLASSSAPVAGC